MAENSFRIKTLIISRTSRCLPRRFGSTVGGSAIEVRIELEFLSDKYRKRDLSTISIERDDFSANAFGIHILISLEANSDMEDGRAYLERIEVEVGQTDDQIECRRRQRDGPRWNALTCNIARKKYSVFSVEARPNGSRSILARLKCGLARPG